MTDSPFFHAPVEPKEQPVLDRLVYVRDQLQFLKIDKSKYVKSTDVNCWYDEVCKQAEELEKIRGGKRKAEEKNRVDGVLDDCLQLISLFFLTVGRNNEAPASYCLVSTIKRLLDHLKEAAFFAEKDIMGLESRLKKVTESIEAGKGKHHEVILQLLEDRITQCWAILKEVRKILDPIPKELMPMHEKLVSILRSLSGCNTRTTFPVKEVQDLKRQLKTMADGFDGQVIEEPSQDVTIEERLRRYAEKLTAVSYTQAASLPGKEIVRDLLERTILWADIISVRQGKLDARFKDQFDLLLGIRNKLDKLSLTQAWSLRETDLFSYSRSLDRADESRKNGEFVDEEGQPGDLYEQRTLLYLLRKSYASIYWMLSQSEPVSEALQPIYNQLSTLRKCLDEVKKSGGVSSPRELYPYSMKLHSLDNMRQDGKFVVNGDIPEGQASVTAMLNDCFELAYELRNDAEQEGPEESNDEEKDEGDDKPVEMRTAPSQQADGSDTGLTRTVSVK